METRAGAARRQCLAGALAVAVLIFSWSADGAHAFVVLREESTDLESALRWAAAPDPVTGDVGLFDGIQVAIEEGVAETLTMAVTGDTRPEDLAAAEDAIRAAFTAWESTVLRFEVTFDGAVARGPTAGSEIDVFVVPESDPVFQNNAFFGVTDTEFEMVADRVLTNGDVLPGFAIVGADIFLNRDTIAGISGIFTREQQPAALQRLVTHETGHALGFGHPNDHPDFNYDTDGDPLNQMTIDPSAPLADLQLSPNVNVNAVMSNFPAVLDALVLTSLTNDERGGRDALYPGPGPTGCPGDCDASGAVSIDELVRSVRIGLGGAFFLACPAVDRDRNLRASIDELIAGVGAALDGCRVRLSQRVGDLAVPWA